jgi:hypothetical protein
MTTGSRTAATILACVLAAGAGAACAEGLVLAQANAPAATPPAAAEPDSIWHHWFVGTGIGGAFGAKFRVNGQWISFSDELQGATDKSSLIAMNVINGGFALSPNLLVGFSGSLAAQNGKINGEDASVQINNYFAALTYFPTGKGFFVRGGGGYSNILVDSGPGDGERSNGIGVLLGGGYALPIGDHHNITFTLDYSRQFYKRSDTRAEDSQFGAAYIGYMYRR